MPRTALLFAVAVAVTVAAFVSSGCGRGAAGAPTSACDPEGDDAACAGDPQCPGGSCEQAGDAAPGEGDAGTADGGSSQSGDDLAGTDGADDRREDGDAEDDEGPDGQDGGAGAGDGDADGGESGDGQSGDPPEGDCVYPSDCESASCDTVTGTCLPATCSDGIRNQDETDIDCGDPLCGPCADGGVCRDASDCESAICLDTICRPASCTNGVADDDEGDVDCGGPCPACVTGGCSDGAECASGVCADGRCEGPTCVDGVQNGGELGIDCGPDSCGWPCAAGSACTAGTDCVSGICADSDSYFVCRVGSPCCHPSRCGDHLVNQTSEACDDGNNLDCVGDGVHNCAADCSRELFGCGDGVLCAMPCGGAYAAPFCGEVCDGAAVGDSACTDFAFLSGTLLCNATCDGFSFVACQDGCGNGRVDPGEACDSSGTASSADDALGGRTCTDFGFTGGSLACALDCGDFAVSGCTGWCGDGRRDPSEQCDPGDALNDVPPDLDGATCASVSSSLGGEGLSCHEDCTYDTSMCEGCGNGRAEGTEQCDGLDLAGADCHTADPAFDAGVLRCSAACTLDVEACTDCGNGVIEQGELCDGAAVTVTCAAVGPFTGGELRCDAACAGYDTSSCIACGDNVASGAEACDGPDLRSQTCQDFEVLPGVPYEGGVLACNSSCTGFVTDGCWVCGPCFTGAVCVEGTCVCPQLTTQCDLGDGTLACVDTRSDASHCGDCTTACTDTACVAGVCSTTACILPEVYVASEQRCVNTTIDNDCCGTSCVDCPDGQVCHKAACVPPLVVYEAPARCLGGGPAIALGIGGVNDCAADLAQVTFRWAVCTCDTLVLNAAMTTDSFDSTVAPYPLTETAERLGAGIGANTSIDGSGIITCGGTLWSGGTIRKASGQTYVRQEIHVDDELLLAGGTLGDVSVPGSGDLYSDGPVSGGGTTVLGHVYQSPAYFEEGCTTTSCDVLGLSGLAPDRYHAQPQTVVDACDCSATQLVPVEAIIAAHACETEGTDGCSGVACCARSNNHNGDIGLDPGLLASGAGGRLDLPCGHYYLRAVDVSAVTLYAYGNTALYIDGDFQPDKFEISLAPTAQLDIFVRGGFCNANQSNLGTPSYPAQLRVYVGGSGSPCGPSSVYSVDIKGASHVAGNVYGPWGGFKFGAHAESFGGIFTKSFQADASSLLHYDRGVVHVGDDTCPPPCGNGILDALEACDGSNLAGESCQTLGFDGGVLACAHDCSGFATEYCHRCGDAVVQLPERCEPGVTPLPERCESLGYDAGVLACSRTCTFDTTECRTCGNGAIEAGEACDGALLGGMSCERLGYDGGVLGCAEDCVSYDTSGCYACGDGTLDVGEQCDSSAGDVLCSDLGYSGGTVGCRGDCTFDTSGCYFCGDYVRQNPPEECDGTALGGATCDTVDPFFDGGVLGCSATCAYDTSGCTTCGDGLREGTERCDGDDLAGRSCQSLGFASGTLACNADCTFDASDCDDPLSCGNGQLDSTEECDLTAADALGGATCATLGFSGGTLGCTATCTFDIVLCAFCGDGEKDDGEECDGMDLGEPPATCAALDLTTGSPSCSSTCTLEPGTCATCGDGVLQPSEICDPAGEGTADDLFAPGTSCVTAGFDGGSIACAPAGGDGECTLLTDECYVCGDGTIDAPWESCEPPLAADADGDLGVASCASLIPGTVGTLSCYANCTYDTSACTTCGNGVIDDGEDCDGESLGGESCAGLGFYTGELSCVPAGSGASCQFDISGCTSCGNDTREGTEVCDGADLDSETCVTQGFKDGVLACVADCGGFDTSGCVMCTSCRDCSNQACVGGRCGACTDSSQCCAPLLCVSGRCTLF